MFDWIIEVGFFMLKFCDLNQEFIVLFKNLWNFVYDWIIEVGFFSLKICDLDQEILVLFKNL